MQEESKEKPGAESRRTSDRPQNLRRGVKRVWPFALGIAAAFLGVLLYGLLFPPPAPLGQDQVDESIIQAMASATAPPPYSAQVYQAILPSLVLIKTQGENHEEEDGVGVGSGVVINESSDILTAYHVVADASEIEVIFSDGTKAGAEIIAAQPENDIAVLHPSQPAEVTVPAILGNPNAMRIGDETFAVGNPLGLTGSLSAGVISGFDRTLPLNDDGDRLEGLIQFDAAVNPGNSGGPLLNRDGQVVGIVTALANPAQQDFFTGIGFAVPISTAVSAAGGPDI
jgi:S1-C subfamily serine protease